MPSDGLRFARAQAEKAKCFSPEDKRKLLQAIVSAFGSCAPFNALVRSTLAAKAEESMRIAVQGDGLGGAKDLAEGAAEFAGPAHQLNEKKKGGGPIHSLNPFKKSSKVGPA